jgi:riboflavin kinase/FMN adenylyltransferase
MLSINNDFDINSSSAVALGYFDGLHIGHKEVLNSAINQKKDGLKSIVFTFKENPLCNISKTTPKRILTNSLKVKMLDKMGFDYIYCPEFKDVKNLSCSEFVDKILYKLLRAKKVFCGYNYRFGKGGTGDFENLKSLCKKYNIDAFQIDEVNVEGLKVSSSEIRRALLAGDIEMASKLLGYNYCFDFIVEKGRQLGRTLGFPTLNQVFPSDHIIPAFGVYASVTKINGQNMCSVTNIGVKPTVGADSPLAETYVPNIKLDIFYGRQVKVKLYKLLREEKKFANIDDLKYAVKKDADDSKNVLKGLKIF